LWNWAWEVESVSSTSKAAYEKLEFCLQNRIIMIAQRAEECTPMWKALRYGSCMGSPVTPFVERMFRAERSAVLLSFHVAGRLSEWQGDPKQKATWALMGRVPPEVIHKLLVHADLEISEAWQGNLSRPRSVLVQPGEAEAGWLEGVKEYVIPARVDERP
jgi:hypothetical protein